jgi:DNA-binding MarR family transcriptional regulator
MPTPRSRIQSEIRQSRPFPNRGQECLVGLLRTADVVRKRLAGIVGARGVTLQQYNVLRILRGAGAGGLPTLEIAARMIERAPGVTRLLDRLERQDLVRRVRCREDRRQVLCTISAKGRARLAELDAPVARADDTSLGALRPSEVATLIRLLDAVRTPRRKTWSGGISGSKKPASVTTPAGK